MDNTYKKREQLLKKEQYYLDKFQPSLNINKIAGSMLGFKHSDENKLKFSILRRGKSHSNYFKNPGLIRA